MQAGRGQAVGPGGQAVGPGGRAVGPGGQAVGPGGQAVGPGGQAVGLGGQAVGPGGQESKEQKSILLLFLFVLYHRLNCIQECLWLLCFLIQRCLC